VVAEDRRPSAQHKAGDQGRTVSDNRSFVNGVLWVLRSGAYWSHMPERYGSYCTGRQGRMIDFWVAFSEVVIIVRRLIWEA
jgi:transposase